MMGDDGARVAVSVRNCLEGVQIEVSESLREHLR